jgi:hypothetical protein
MHFARWISKATDKHSEYVILFAFPWKQWLCESILVLHYTYIACLVIHFHMHAVLSSCFYNLEAVYY